jgi:hypothetical protein
LVNFLSAKAGIVVAFEFDCSDEASSRLWRGRLRRHKGPFEEWRDVSHRTRDVVVLFPHRSDVVHRTLCRLDALQTGDHPGGQILRREAAA